MAHAAGYTCVRRPAGAAHGFPALVFDSRQRLDLPLIVFVRQAQRRLSPRSVRVYLYALLPFLTFVARAAAAQRAAVMEHLG